MFGQLKLYNASLVSKGPRWLFFNPIKTGLLSLLHDPKVMDQKLMDYVRRFGIQGVLVFSYSIRKLLTFPRVRLWHSWAASHLLRSFARYLFRVLHPLAIVPATTPILKLWFLWRCRYFAFTMGCLGGDLKG